MSRLHTEHHRHNRIGWLRAAVLGANDGIISVSSILLGVATAHAARSSVLLSGVAGLTAGAMSMAAGEYVSVSSQSDTELADEAREKAELEEDPSGETAELANIYRQRGVSAEVAAQVAHELMQHDALGAHMRDELGITEMTNAQPVQAALASAASFTVGAAFPLAIAVLSPSAWAVWSICLCSLVVLAALGATAARVGGASLWKGAARVALWGAFAMAVTAGIGAVVAHHSL